MRQKTITLYKFNELSDAAQRRAWENGPDFSDDHADEYRATLAAFENVFDIKVYRYNVGYPGTTFSYVKAGAAAEAPENRPVRLATYIWNNYAADISKGRYYSTRGRYVNGEYTYKSRHSRITFEMDNCPLTGVCMDYDILQPILDCLHYKRFYDSIDDLFDDCLTAFFRAWECEIEYNCSFEHFAEMCEANDYEFLETGEMY